MKTVSYTICRPDTGAVLPRAVVTVYLTDGVTKAAIFNTAGASIANPVTADVNGAITISAADGDYILSAVSADGSVSVPPISVEIYDVRSLIDSAPAHAQAFYRKIRAKQEDVSVLFLTDSTGDASNEWPYRFITEDLKPKVPEISIVDRLYVDGSGWGAPTAIQTVPGGRTLTVARACIAGSGFAYSQGGKEAEVILGLGLDYDLVVVSHGHNFGFLLPESSVYDHVLISMRNLLALAPRADFFVTLQNPWLRHLSYSRGVRSAFTRVAAKLGLGIIDIYSEFAALGDLDNPEIGGEGGTIDLAYYQQDGQGGLHPSAPDGQNVSLPAVRRALAERDVAGVPTIFRPHSVIAAQVLPNPKFTDWTGSGPDGYSLNNVTVAKSVAYAETGVYCMAVTCGSGDPSITFDLSKDLPRFAGRDVYILARVRVPASMVTANTLRAGRVQLSTTGPSGNRSKTSLDLVRGTDGWRDAFAIHSVRADDVSLTGTIFCGNADGSSAGQTLHIDFVMVGVGDMPGSLDPRYAVGQYVSDLYNFAATGIPSGSTGTLALSGPAKNTITVTGGTAGSTRAYLNISNTVRGRFYRLSHGIRTFTGAAGLTISARGPNGGGGTFSVTTTNGSPNLTGITVPLAPGQPIAGTGIPAGTTILSVGNGTAVMSANATASGTISALTTSGSILNNQSIIFAATGSSHSFTINGGADVTGFSIADLTVTEIFDGIATPIVLPISAARNIDLTAIDATGSSTRWRTSASLGNPAFLLGPATTNGSNTATALWEDVLPQNYIPGRELTVTINALYSGTGTVGATRTIDVAFYRLANAGTVGSDLVTTSAQQITTTGADYAFTVAGATLAPGDRVQIVAIGALQETGGTNPLTARINSVRLS